MSLRYDRLFRYTNLLQQQLLVKVSDEDIHFVLSGSRSHPLISDVQMERDREVFLDSVGCIDHPA